MFSNKKKFSSIKRFFLFALISILLGLRLYSWNAKTLVGNEMPMPFGVGISVVLSGSMEPELSVNDIVLVMQKENYDVGDIVVYQDGHSLVIHRIINIDNDKITTQGDANNAPDLPISPEQVKGAKAAVIPYVGVLVRFLKSSVGFVLVLIGAVILIELPYYKDQNKMITEQERLKEEIRRLKEE